jgi:hypothetical protein
MKFLFASLKTLTSNKKSSTRHIKFLFRFFRSHWRFSPVYIHGWLSEQFSGSQGIYKQL